MYELQEKARLLRQKGYTYPQIVEELPGITPDWCKKNLSSVVKVSCENTDKAICMRVSGSTYNEIVKALSGSGITEHWCKTHLKEVQKNKPEADLIRLIIKEATKPEGVTNYTIKGLVMNSSKSDKADDFTYISALKKKAKRLDEKCLFRPSWLSPKQALASRDSMYDKANTIFERLQELALEHAIQFDVT